MQLICFDFRINWISEVPNLLEVHLQIKLFGIPQVLKLFKWRFYTSPGGLEVEQRLDIQLKVNLSYLGGSNPACGIVFLWTNLSIDNSSPAIFIQILNDHSQIYSELISLRGYEVTKKAWYGRKMVDCRKMSKKNARYYSRDYWRLLAVPGSGVGKHCTWWISTYQLDWHFNCYLSYKQK